MSTKPLRRKFISHNILHYLRDCVIIILYKNFPVQKTYKGWS